MNPDNKMQKTRITGVSENMVRFFYKLIIKTTLGWGIEGIPVARFLSNKVHSYLNSGPICIEGSLMYLDKKDSLFLSVYREYETFETDILKSIVKSGFNIIDLGANIGYYTLIFAKLAGPRGSVISFEPDHDNFQLLLNNIKANKFNNVTAVNKAVSEKNGTIKLFLSSHNNGDHRVYDSGDARESVIIKTVSVDNYIDSISKNKIKIDLVKIDIQGAEFSAIMGMLNTLRNNNSIIIVSEFWPHGLSKFGIKPVEYLKLLRNNGFEIYNMNEKSQKISKVSDKSLIGNYTEKEVDCTNILCVKKLANLKTKKIVIDLLKRY